MFTTASFSGHRRDGDKNPSDWTDVGGWFGGMFGGRSSSGIVVTRERALALASFRACVTLLAESVAQLPCELYERTEDGGRKKATGHPLYDVIRHCPNQQNTAFEFYEQCQGSYELEGNDYSLINRDGNGNVSELIPINPNKCQVLIGSDGLTYYRMLEGGEVLSRRYVHHVRGFTLDGHLGLSPLQTNRDTIGLAAATDDHAAAVFNRGATMSGVLERPLEAPKIKTQAGVDRLIDKFTERHGGGLRNAFSVALLQDGMSYKQLSMDNEKAQLIESRNLGAIEICRLYRIPGHMVGVMEKSTAWGTGIEQLGMAFVIYTLLARLRRREQAMMRDLLNTKDRQKYYIEFNVSSLMRGDQKTRYEAYAIGRQWGWLSVNDILRMENLPPIASGNTYLTPLNMVDSDIAAKMQEVKPEVRAEVEALLQSEIK